jgi:hypothetical protein
MPALVDIRYPLNEWQQLAVEEAAAAFPDLWRMRVDAAGPEQPGGFRVYVDGPDAATSRPFDVEAAPVEIGTYLRIVRRQLTR